MRGRCLQSRRASSRRRRLRSVVGGRLRIGCGPSEGNVSRGNADRGVFGSSRLYRGGGGGNSDGLIDRGVGGPGGGFPGAGPTLALDGGEPIDLRLTYLRGADLKGARLDRVRLAAANLERADLIDAQLANSRLRRAALLSGPAIRNEVHRLCGLPRAPACLLRRLTTPLAAVWRRPRGSCCTCPRLRRLPATCPGAGNRQPVGGPGMVRCAERLCLRRAESPVRLPC